MGTLTALLKNNKPVKKETKVKVIEEQTIPFVSFDTVSPAEDTPLIGTLTPENYELVKGLVATIDTNGKSRREIIIGMFGAIKNPTTNKRFNIPNITWDDEDYMYEYAKCMKTLVYRPDEFTKVMNWE